MNATTLRLWRSGIGIVKAFSFLLVILGFSPVGPSVAAVKPNVVLISMDDGGVGDIGAYGSKDIRTPNIDALAAQGVRATAGYSAAPMCMPSRAALLTGRYPQRFGVENNAGPAYPHYGLPLDETTLASALKSIGYTTGAIGKWHLGDDNQFHPNNRGFSYFYGFAKGCCHSYFSKPNDTPIERNGVVVPDPYYPTTGFGTDAVNFIRAPRPQPFFLYVAFNAAHEIVQALPTDLALYPNLTGVRQTFAAVVSALDREVGRIVAEVGKLSRPTLIIFLSDNGATPYAGGSNGPFTSGGKGTLYEGGYQDAVHHGDERGIAGGPHRRRPGEPARHLSDRGRSDRGAASPEATRRHQHHAADERVGYHPPPRPLLPL
ncbi:MAG: sulfatase-like hydrolase/transferase [Rhodospirillales bacterium]